MKGEIHCLLLSVYIPQCDLNLRTPDEVQAVFFLNQQNFADGFIFLGKKGF